MARKESTGNGYGDRFAKRLKEFLEAHSDDQHFSRHPEKGHFYLTVSFDEVRDSLLSRTATRTDSFIRQCNMRGLSIETHEGFYLVKPREKDFYIKEGLIDYLSNHLPSRKKIRKNFDPAENEEEVLEEESSQNDSEIEEIFHNDKKQKSSPNPSLMRFFALPKKDFELDSQQIEEMNSFSDFDNVFKKYDEIYFKI